MDCNHRIEVPLRSGGGKKMKKRRELDALIAHSLTKRTTRRAAHGAAQDKLLSTDDPEDYWTNVAGPTRRSHRIYFRMCGPLLLAIASALFVAILYWLYFDLRQQIFDYRQKIEEVSAMSKNFPDTLQKWHETSSFLLKNQTTVILRINELQRTVEGLRTNLSGLEASVNAQRNFGKEEKLVADFGAKLEAVVTDIDGIKEHYNRYTETQKNVLLELEAFKANLSSLSTQQPKTLPANFSEDVKNLNETLKISLKELENNLRDVNNTLSQKSKMLHEEILVHKTKLDDLLDRSENITSHVTTLSNSWPEYKQKIVNFDESLDKIDKEISLTKSISSSLVNKVEELNNLCKKHAEPIIVTQIGEKKAITAQPIINVLPDKVLPEASTLDSATTTPKQTKN